MVMVLDSFDKTRHTYEAFLAFFAAKLIPQKAAHVLLGTNLRIDRLFVQLVNSDCLSFIELLECPASSIFLVSRSAIDMDLGSVPPLSSGSGA